VRDDVALLDSLYLLQLQVHTLLQAEAIKEGHNADGLTHKPVGAVPPGHHKLLQQSIIKDGGLLFHIFVEAFDEKSQSGVQQHYLWHWKGWAPKSRDFQGPPLPMPLVMLLHSSKPLRTAP
jgi:hypothetical protein